MLKAIIDIARGLGKQTVAEFVEDADTAALLRDLGVDYGQGFHLGTPAPLAEHLAARSSNGAAPTNGAAPPAST